MSDSIEELSDSINIISSIIKKFKNEPKVEIKLRIGIFESGKFCPGLHSIDFFSSTKSLLDSNHFWDSVSTEKTTDSIYKNITKSGMTKVKTEVLHLSDFSYQNTPFDFKVVVSRDTPCSDKMMSKITREKLTYSYTETDYKFNLIRVIETNGDSSEESYEFEIELLNLENNTSDIYRSHSVLLKIRDIINHCETISNAKVVLISPQVDFSNLKLT